ncbi:hypothetical protein A4A49_62035, partial [Nicotiana attenuata]
ENKKIEMLRQQEEMPKQQIEMWKQQAVEMEQGLKDLDGDLEKQFIECYCQGLDKGGKLAMVYLVKNRQKIDEAIRAAKRLRGDEESSSVN